MSDVQKRESCEVCKKSFARHSDLNFHMRYHTGEKLHICTICERGFPRKHHLRNHVRTHTREKPHVCQYCNRPFSQPSTLKKHIRTHTVEAKYRCQTCAKAYRRSDDLKKHTPKCKAQQSTANSIESHGSQRNSFETRPTDAPEPNIPGPLTLLSPSSQSHNNVQNQKPFSSDAIQSLTIEKHDVYNICNGRLPEFGCIKALRFTLDN